jgi:hypothetical protein
LAPLASARRTFRPLGVNLSKVGLGIRAAAPRGSRVIRESENIRPHIGFVPDNPCRDQLPPTVDSWAILPTKERLYTMIAPHKNRPPNALADRGRTANQQ